MNPPISRVSRSLLCCVFILLLYPMTGNSADTPKKPHESSGDATRRAQENSADATKRVQETLADTPRKITRQLIPMKQPQKDLKTKPCYDGWQYLAPNDPNSHCKHHIAPGTYVDSICELDPTRPGRDCRRVSGGYTCRLDDFPTDDACPSGTILIRHSTRFYRCMALGVEVPPEKRSCIAGFNLIPKSAWTYVDCVAEGADRDAEVLMEYVCTDPKASRINATSSGGENEDGGRIVDLCCGYFGNRLPVRERGFFRAK